jgi:nucleotide-binding universal stress UspA family protein
MYKRILLCADGSEGSVKAAQATAEIAKRFGSEITVLSVFFPTPLLASFGEAPEAAACMETVISIGEDQHEAIQASVRKLLAEQGLKAEEMREFGHPVDTIVNAAKQIDADLVVMGSRGMSGFKSLLLGSVSDGVLHHAHCPVLIVR